MKDLGTWLVLYGWYVFLVLVVILSLANWVKTKKFPTSGWKEKYLEYKSWEVKK